ncbi:MAG: alpha/beta hydrolase family protein [Planctomycetes bacterium]|nr:alpha/beta hydrolase family protein [Planctomycetota bacterium]
MSMRCARALLALALLACSAHAQLEATRVVLADQEGECWLARRASLALVHLDGPLEDRRRELGALSAHGVADNLLCFAPRERSTEQLAEAFRTRATEAERARLAAFAAGGALEMRMMEALAALELAPPQLELGPELRWRELPEGAVPLLVLDAEGALRSCWAGSFAFGTIDVEAFRAAGGAALLERAKPAPFDVDNGWDWHVATPLALEAGRCAARPVRGRAPRDEAEERALERFPRECQPFEWRLKWRQRTKLWSSADLDLPSGLPSGHAVNDLARVRYFRGERAAEERRPAFVLLHHLQENFALEEAVARALAARGVDVALVILPYYGPRHPPRRALSHLVFGAGEAGLAQVAAQARADIARVRDWLASRRDVSAVHLGGISLGGIFAALIGGVDGDWPKLAPILAGGDLAAILRADSREARGIRRELGRVGLELEDVLRAWSALDPLAFAGRIDPAAVLMVNAESDEVIPRASTLALARALGGAEIAWFPGGHKSVASKLPAILERLGEFLIRS